MDREFKHYLVTRFNIKAKGREAKISASPDWLEKRFELFEKYTLPSVSSQTCRDFHWHIYFDDQTPPKYKDRIDAAISSCPQIVPIFTESWDYNNVRDDILQDSNEKYILSTRLDNDDIVSSSFIFETQQASRQAQPGDFLVPLNGAILAGDKLYWRRDGSNPFSSVLESREVLNSIWSTPHTEYAKWGRVLTYGKEVLWIQVVHGGNVSNRIRGYRVSNSSLVGFDEGVVGPIAAPSIVTVMADRLFGFPARCARDFARSVAGAIIRTIGVDYDGRVRRGR